jgi:hypothetical protein
MTESCHELDALIARTAQLTKEESAQSSMAGSAAPAGPARDPSWDTVSLDLLAIEKVVAEGRFELPTKGL